MVLTAVHMDGETKVHFVKRFKIETLTVAKRFGFIAESKGSKLLAVTANPAPELEIKLQRDKKSDRETEKIKLHEFIDVKGWKAQGNRLNYYKIHALALLTDEGPEPERREVNKRRRRSAAAENGSLVGVTEAEVAQSQEVLKRPKAQLGLAL